MTELIIALENEEIEVEIVKIQAAEHGTPDPDGWIRLSAGTYACFRQDHPPLCDLACQGIEENRSQMFARRQYLAENPYDIPEWESLTASDKK